MTDQWIGLELRHLAALRAIADEGSFKGAARLLGYTPSAISQQIATLERIVGARLIAREHGRKALGPTEEGKILLRHLSAIEARLTAAKSDIDAYAHGIAGPLRIGTFESVGTRLLPDIIGEFGEMFRDVRVEVDDAILDLELLRLLERGAFDLVFANLPLPPGPFATSVVLDDPWVLVVQADPTAQAHAALTLSEIAELPLVTFHSGRAIESALAPFRSAGIEPSIVFRSDYNEVVQGFAAAGLGVALMPRLAVNPRDERTSIVELPGLIPPRQVSLVWHSEHPTTETMDAFVKLACRVGSRVASGEAPRARPFVAPFREGRLPFAASSR